MKTLLTLLLSFFTIISFSQKKTYQNEIPRLLNALIHNEMGSIDSILPQKDDFSKLTNCKYELAEDMILGVVNKLKHRKESYVKEAQSSLKKHNINSFDTIIFIGSKKDFICTEFNIIHLYYNIDNKLIEFIFYEINEKIYLSDKSLINQIIDYSTWEDKEGIGFYLDADIQKSSSWKNSFYEKNKDNQLLSKPK